MDVSNIAELVNCERTSFFSSLQNLFCNVEVYKVATPAGVAEWIVLSLVDPVARDRITLLPKLASTVCCLSAPDVILRFTTCTSEIKEQTDILHNLFIYPFI